MATSLGYRLLIAAGLPAALACAPHASAQDPPCAGLTLPAGFCATIVADDVGSARHLAVLPNGDLAVALEGRLGGVLVLRDSNGDGVADARARFGPRGGTGIAYGNGYLYFALNDMILRWRWSDGALEPAGPPDTVVSGLAHGRQHAAKSIALGTDGMLYVNIGAPSNSCQVEDRQLQSPGRDPCPILDTAGGIWRFDASRLHQTEADGYRFATGLRNVVALTVDPATNQVYGVQHGRDQLSQNWPRLYDDSANAEKPAEEFFHLVDGGNYGWPYCFYDPALHQKILNPEYGGDGHTVGRCAQMQMPLMAFPAHYAPDGIVFYHGTQFPEAYRGGVFIAFHGSWNRAPLPQEGYNVVFVPMANGRPSGEWTVFANGFRGDPGGRAAHRPVGLAVGRDGSLYVADDTGGRIYRISYTGR